MNILRFDLNKIYKSVIIISFVIALLYFGRPILAPLVFALFLSLLLLPICEFFEHWSSRLTSIIITFLLVSLVIAGIMFFFGTQFYYLFESLRNFSENLEKVFDEFILLVDNWLTKSGLKLEQIINERQQGGIIKPADLLQQTIASTSSFIVSITLVFVYTFLFLLYRASFKNFILISVPEEKRDYMSGILTDIRKVVKDYFVGLIIIILILGTLNGFGLWIIGLDFPFLFGFFAAILAIIPYIGTFIGGLLPFVYALVNADSLWTPLLVVLWYGLVQSIEGNFLTPKIVGSRVSINPLFALIALLIGGFIWGIPGMILFIPLLAIVKVILDTIEPMKPLGVILSSHFGKEKPDNFDLLRNKFLKAIKKLKN
ncbi:MAG: AI-2E family transporter [Bacteroidetes bacterium]|nr:AI-2E family transporter [Bacteroidota bacterium]